MRCRQQCQASEEILKPWVNAQFKWGKGTGCGSFFIVFSGMKQVTLKPLQHRQQELIGIYFDGDARLNRLIRKQPGINWSQTNKCWYAPLNKETHSRLIAALKNKAEVEQSALHDYLSEKKKGASGTGRQVIRIYDSPQTTATPKLPLLNKPTRI